MNTNIERFWNEFLRETGRSSDTMYQSCFHFELTESLADELLRLVLIGQKKATCCALEYFRCTGEAMPKIGDMNVITNWHGEPKCVIKTKAVTILPFCDVTYEICRREGEDDTLESWQRGHRRFFTEDGKQLGYDFREDMMIVFEDFEVIYQTDK